ncbi:hypothetical protein G6F64_015236 [Rhizopus arrhizus]|uniref:Uncharacterized protein n=1 Tax=Rhizopus oryzae TaxID=64495 RepID=A0A9P6WRX8_RHIOR|nr:hypothetical protein G6F64_015236 [Rhizopus arrhizus]
MPAPVRPDAIAAALVVAQAEGQAIGGDTAPADAAARGQRRGHAAQAQQEQRSGDEVAGLDQPVEQFDGADVQACGSFG